MLLTMYAFKVECTVFVCNSKIPKALKTSFEVKYPQNTFGNKIQTALTLALLEA